MRVRLRLCWSPAHAQCIPSDLQKHFFPGTVQKESDHLDLLGVTFEASLFLEQLPKDFVS